MTHGIMFHHFHGGDHIKAQGSLSAKDLEDMLDFYGRDHNVIGAKEYYDKALSGTLSDSDVALTFDDALCCQYEVAYPVLKKRNLTAFWFVYTSPFTGVYEKLEIYHHFRFYTFSDIDEYYEAFFSAADALSDEFGFVTTEELSDNKYKQYKPLSTFYTENDRKFRHARDNILGFVRYNKVMERMMSDAGYDYKKWVDRLWIKADDIKILEYDGNIVGLHSHTHPTTLGSFSYEEQLSEYQKCSDILADILGKRPDTASYPCDSFNDDTKPIMQSLGVKLGFRAYMEKSTDPYFIPRMDHALILREMR